MVSSNTFRKNKEFQEAFQEDCELLLKSFILHNTLSYAQFTEIWKESRFSLVFVGQYKEFEVGHFTNMVFHCTKKYLLLSNCKYTQTGGLYLLYGLYYKQPIKHLIKIRILHEELTKIKEYLNEITQANTENSSEPIYIFNKLLKDNAFEFVASQHELFIDSKFITTDIILFDDIFPNHSGSIINEFMEETNLALSEFKEVDDALVEKLNAYKAKHKNVFLEYDPSYHNEMINVLTTNEHLSQLLPQQEVLTSEAVMNQEMIDEARLTSNAKRDIVNKAFASDTRSKHLKQLVGDEAIPNAQNTPTLTTQPSTRTRKSKQIYKRKT